MKPIRTMFRRFTEIQSLLKRHYIILFFLFLFILRHLFIFIYFYYFQQFTTDPLPTPCHSEPKAKNVGSEQREEPWPGQREEPWPEQGEEP